MFRHLFVIFCLLAFSIQAQNKPVLTVVALEVENYTNADGTGAYWALLDTVIGDEFSLRKKTVSLLTAQKMMKKGSADAVIGVTKHDIPSLIWSSKHIGFSYPVYAVFARDDIKLNSIKDLENYSVALQTNSPLANLISKQYKQYDVKSIYRVDNLILNNRVDLALTYSYNLHLVSPQRRLSYKKILPKQKLYLGFTNTEINKEIVTKFNQRFAKAIQDNKIMPLFPTRLSYIRAELTQPQMSQHAVHWNLMPKLYNQKTRQLEVIERESKFIETLMLQLPEFNATYTQNPASALTNLYHENEAFCYMGIKREAPSHLSFINSKPTHAFIKPRLFLHQKFYLQHIREKAAHNTGRISLLELQAAVPAGRIAITNKSNIDVDITQLLGEQGRQYFYIVNELEYENMVNMLLNERVSGMIAWPSMVAELLTDKKQLEQLRSLTLDDNVGQNYLGHIYCSPTQTGELMIDKIDSMLNDKVKRNMLLEHFLNDLDTDSQQEFLSIIKP